MKKISKSLLRVLLIVILVLIILLSAYYVINAYFIVGVSNGKAVDGFGRVLTQTPLFMRYLNHTWTGWLWFIIETVVFGILVFVVNAIIEGISKTKKTSEDNAE